MAYFDIRFLAVMLKVQFLAELLQLMAKLRSTQSNLNFLQSQLIVIIQ